jgi:hypothetical protein
MNPKRFLSVGGTVLVLTGLLGVTHVLGRMSRASFFHPPYWINWFHLAFGGLVLSVATRGTPRWQATMALMGAIMGTTLGVAGLTLGPAAAKRFGVEELADPSDHTAHLLVGLVALWGWLGRESS